MKRKPRLWNPSKGTVASPWPWNRARIILPFWAGGGVPQEYAARILPTLAADGTWGSIATGKTLDFPASVVDTPGLNLGAVAASSDGGRTLIWHGTINDWDNSDHRYFFVGQHNQGTNTYDYGFYLGSDLANIYFFPVTGSNVSATITVAEAAQPLTIVGTYRPNDARLYLGLDTGEIRTGSSGAISGAITAVENFYVDAVWTDGRPGTSTGFVALLDGTITDQQATRIIRDPFASFRPHRRRVYAVPSAPAGDPEGPLIGGKLLGGILTGGRLVV